MLVVKGDRQSTGTAGNWMKDETLYPFMFVEDKHERFESVDHGFRVGRMRGITRKRGRKGRIESDGENHGKRSGV